MSPIKICFTLNSMTSLASNNKWFRISLEHDFGPLTMTMKILDHFFSRSLIMCVKRPSMLWK